MSLLRILGIACASLLILAGTSSAQVSYVGDPSLGFNDMVSGGQPPTVAISGLQSISDYAFDGSDLTIPFTLEGTASGGATVWLIIYTAGQHPPLTITGEGPGPHRDSAHSDPGWHVFQDVDWLVYNSAGRRFDEGDNEIVWNGQDNDGNVVPNGSYDLFLAVFDDEAPAHIVGYADGKLGAGQIYIIDPDKGTVTRPFNWVVDMTNNFHDNPQAAQFIDRQPVHDAAPDAGDVSSSGFWYAESQPWPWYIENVSPLGTSNDVTENLRSFVANGPGQGGGKLFRGFYDPATLTVTPDEDWGADHGAVNGFIDYNELQPVRKYTCIANPEETKVYTTSGMDGTVGTIVVWDVETGERLDTWDVSDIFLYDNNGSDRVGGPAYASRLYDGKPDPFGLTTSSHHTSIILRQDWDTGEIKYIQRNGDVYGDMLDPAEGGDIIYGHTSGHGGKYGLDATRWGWTAITQSSIDNVNYGAMLGEDGSGLFFFQPKNIPSSYPQYTIVVDTDDDGPWDGIYLSIGELDPNERSNDWAIADDNDFISYYWYHYLAHLPYDQKRVSLGVPTAVEELEGAPLPSSYALGDAYPNPFNPETTIRFSLPWEAPVSVKIYNDQGQFVRDLVSGQMGPGEFTVTWDGKDASGAEVASGVYVYKIESTNLKLSKKVTFLK